jgi:iron(II)-dependent oxidoreductase
MALHRLLLLVGAAAAADPGKTYPGPASQADTAAWLANLHALRAQWRSEISYNSSVYDTALLWSPASFIAPQSHIYDRFLYDPALATPANPAAGWTVGRFLDDLAARFGGIDAVLLWGTYPNMGVDERSQFDLLEDFPGGLAALKAVVAQFNARGVQVGLPYNRELLFRHSSSWRRSKLPLP